MIKITITDTEKQETHEMEGKVIVAHILDPDGKDGYCTNALIGRGNMDLILKRAAAALGALTLQAIDDDWKRFTMRLEMGRLFRNAVKGKIQTILRTEYESCAED